MAAGRAPAPSWPAAKPPQGQPAGQQRQGQGQENQGFKHPRYYTTLGIMAQLATAPKNLGSILV